MSWDLAEEHMDLAVDDLRECIKTEEQIITEKHDLHIKIQQLNDFYGYLDEHIPKDMQHLHDLNHVLYENMLDLEAFIEEEGVDEIGFVREEKDYLDRLEKDVEHREWQAIKSYSKHQVSATNEHVRLEVEQLEGLHKLFVQFMKRMKKNRCIKEMHEELDKQKVKKDFKSKEEYYFSEIYKFLRSNERIIRHLWRKERVLRGKVKRVLKDL